MCRALRHATTGSVAAELARTADPDAETAWAMEIERRVEAIEAGTVETEPWEDVKRRIESEILRR